MHRTRAIGLGLLLVGVFGYLLGVQAPYPGRAFSITAVMLGVTLTAIGGESE